MNMNGNLAVAVMAGISIGAFSVMLVHAQEAKTPPSYLIAETEVTDRAAFQKYAEKVPETLAPFRVGTNVGQHKTSRSIKAAGQGNHHHGSSLRWRTNVRLIRDPE